MSGLKTYAATQRRKSDEILVANIFQGSETIYTKTIALFEFHVLLHYGRAAGPGYSPFVILYNIGDTPLYNLSRVIV